MLTTSPPRHQLPLPTSSSSWRRLLIIISCVLHAFPCLAGVTANPTLPRRKFKAAVYEHAVIRPEDPTEIVSREEALTLMRKNLDVYEEQVAEAKRQGADILVFPEDGLYGFRFTWWSLTPYMEFVPDPEVIDWIPCLEPDRFPNTEVQYALSCMARNHSLYIVANMGDKQPCHPHVLPNCNHVINHDKDVTGSGSGSGSGLKRKGAEHVQYNTDVAFDPEGKLVARYHKQNLFFEKQFDRPPSPELSTFNTPFGRWGMITCFDILFHEPAVTLVKKLGIANIAFPTAWMDALPLLASVQFHSAFARGLGVNFLAANIHLPRSRFQGSGVYGPKGMVAFVHNASLASEGRLIVTEVDVLHRPEPEAGNRKGNVGDVIDVENDVQEMDFVNKKLGYSASDDADNDDSEIAVSEDTFLVGYSDVTDFNDQEGNGESNSTSLDEATLAHYETAFVSELFHDLFNFVQLDRAEDSLRVCHGNVCCHLTYSLTHKDRDHPELFALGAFDGLHTYEGSYYLQICALVRCADDNSRHSCGSPTSQSSTVFQALTLRAEMQTEFVYPEVLLVSEEDDQLRLAEAQEWSFGAGPVIRSEKGFSYPLLSSALFGRWYDRDTEMNPAAPEKDFEVAGGSAASAFVLWERVMMMVCVACVAFFVR